ncbi:MAG TPA: PAS-domain containing protein [Alphaproteobacteria bacterium]|nr:PAS-domain containing protein [Alphaproteobacteria bacterium]
MNLLGRMSLRARIILLGMILVLPLALLLVVRSDREAEHEFALARDQARLLVENANGDYGDIILKAQTAVEVVAKTPLAGAENAEACDRFLESIRSSYDWANTLFITDAAGNKSCGTGRNSASSDVSQRAWFKRVLATKAPVVSDYLVGRVTHRPQITVAQPILDTDRNVVGVAAIGIDLATYNAQIARTAHDLDASVTVIDQAGTIVARYPDSDRLIGQKFPDHPFVAHVLKERSGEIEATGIGGARRFFAFEPFGGTSLSIAVGIARQPIVDRVNKQLARSVAILGGLVLACIGVALIGANRLILAPLDKLGDAAAAIGRGEFQAAGDLQTGAPELRRTLGAIGEMAELIARREGDLKAREAQYRTLADHATDLIMLQDLSLVPLYISPASNRMLGYTPDELQHLTVEELVHPDDADRMVQALTGLTEAAPRARSVHRLRHRDGSFLWVEATLLWIHPEDDEPPRILTVVRDITERKQAEDATAALRSLLSDAIEAMQDGIAIYDAEDRLVLANQALRTQRVGGQPVFITGRSYEEIIGIYWNSLLQDRADIDNHIAVGLERHRRGDGYPWEMQDRARNWQLTRHFRTGEGGILTVNTDITALKTAEAEAVRARTLVTDAIDAMTDSISLFDAEDRLVMTNKSLRDRFAKRPDIIAVGRTYEEIVRGNWSKAESEADRAVFERYVAEELDIHNRADGAPREIQARDGSWRLNRQFRTADGGILVVSTDITARREAEAAAIRARELVVDAIEAMQDAVSLYDADERLVLANTALLQRNAGLSALFVPGTKFETLLRGFWSEQDVAANPDAFEAFVTTRLAHFRLGDGTPSESLTADGNWFVSRHFKTRDGGTFSISTEITAAKQAAAEIEAARDAAESANRAKSVFLASMSHEIRTPMNGVLGFAELLQLDAGLSPAQRSHVRGIYDAGKSLLALINDILDFSKIEAGKLEIESIAMSPETVVDGAVSILRSQFVSKGVALSVELEPDVPGWVMGDPMRVRQNLLNLMSNALKFTEKGSVVVRVRRQTEPDGEKLRFEVEDTGIGIPADRLHLLFEEFSQVDRSTTRRYGGTGLGLALCKRLAEAMDGTVGVTSQPGAGSTFWFTVALSPTAAPDVGDRAAPTAELASARILVAEDLPMNQLVIEGYLKRAGHRVTLAGNGLEAVGALQKDSFDLVLMDMEMPEMDGISATRAIRALDGPMRDVPIVALTANALLEDAVSCRAAGMNDFLSKPIDRATLYAAVAKWAGAGGKPMAPPPAAPARMPVLEASIVDDLEAVFGTEQSAEFIALFRTSLTEMGPVFADWNDKAAIRRAAHNLISTAGSIGCLELMQAAKELSQAKDEPAKFDAMQGRMVAALARAASALDRRNPA